MIMKQNQREAMIAEVMEGFDFEQVHRVMTVLDWKWAIDNGVEMVPTHYRIMKQAEKLLNDVSQYEDKLRHEIATGGFRAVFDENERLDKIMHAHKIVNEGKVEKLILLGTNIDGESVEVQMEIPKDILLEAIQQTWDKYAINIEELKEMLREL